MLRLHHGNRLEGLAETLFNRLQGGEADPLQPQTVVVPNPATGRWVAQRLAETRGVAANLDFPLPAGFFWRVLRAWLPGVEESPFDREVLVWRILAVLPGLLREPAFAEPARYVGEGDPLRLYQLTERLADLFDQYLVYRPELLLSWEQGREPDDWQAQLWRALAGGGQAHRARLLQRLGEAMEGPPPEGHDLPERLFLFGLNSLAPVYLELLNKLGRHFEVTLFHLNPCREYWADIHSEGTLARRALAFAGVDDPFAPFLELGNPLLASLGHVGQVFLDQLLSLEAESEDHFERPPGAGLLAQVQDDILCLRDGRASPRPWPEGPDSIQIHGVHGPWREVQVLHDNLLRCFEELPDLEPRDILVMAPDIAAYAPLVEAVFDTQPEGHRIPWNLADRPPGTASPLAEALQWLLRLPQSRCGASELLALLEVPAVQQRLGLDETALERLRQWVRESGIRWGLDGAQREDLGLPADDGLHSWAFGLRRLFLGITLPPGDPPLLDDILPLTDIDDAELPWLGALQALVDVLERYRRKLARPATLAQWQACFAALFRDLFDPTEEEAALLEALSRRLDELVDQAGTAGFGGPLPLEVLRQPLGQVLAQPEGARGFRQGGVTFSNLVPMRALPFRVICLLGMNHDDFPRRQPAFSFDRMAAEPRRGDRDRRRDDRYLFLETLLAAGDRLLISYRSRDPRSDQPCQPAGPVSELMEYLRAAYAGAPETLLVQHPLQPFSPRALDPARPATWSFDARWVLQGEPPAPFVTAPLASPETGQVIALDDLLAFWRDPVAAFLQQRLDLCWAQGAEEIEDDEPFVLNSLEQWHLKQDLLQACLEDRRDEALVRLRAAGRLPHGLAGDNEVQQLLREIEPFAGRIREIVLAEPVPVSLQLGEWRLEGQLAPFHGRGLVDWRVGKSRPSDWVSLWIRHLVLCALREDAGPARFIGSGDETPACLRPVAGGQAVQLLTSLLDLRRRGLSEPLPFFPRTSWAWQRGEDWAKSWVGDDHRGLAGEGDEAWVQIAFRGRDPLNEPLFGELAEAVFGPLLAALEENP